MKLTRASATFGLILLISGCNPTEQKRLLSFSEVSCNVNHVNERIERTDSMFGFNFGGVFGYKRNCSDSGYRQSKDGPEMSEVEAISRNCDEQDNAVDGSAVDKILESGGKIVSVSDVEKIVDIFEKDGGLQPGNKCVGKEYIIEAPLTVFKKYL